MTRSVGAGLWVPGAGGEGQRAHHHSAGSFLSTHLICCPRVPDWNLTLRPHPLRPRGAPLLAALGLHCCARGSETSMAVLPHFEVD